MTNSNRERRRAPRVPADFPIRLDERAEGQLRDLSEIGLCCVYPEPVEELTQVRVGLRLPGDSALHEVQGAVVRCDEVARDEHEIAIYFTEISDSSRFALRRWIRASERAEHDDEMSAM